MLIKYKTITMIFSFLTSKWHQHPKFVAKDDKIIQHVLNDENIIYYLFNYYSINSLIVLEWIPVVAYRITFIIFVIFSGRFDNHLDDVDPVPNCFLWY